MLCKYGHPVKSDHEYLDLLWYVFNSIFLQNDIKGKAGVEGRPLFPNIVNYRGSIHQSESITAHNSACNYPQSHQVWPSPSHLEQFYLIFIRVSGIQRDATTAYRRVCAVGFVKSARA